MISLRGLLAIGIAGWFYVLINDPFGWHRDVPPLVLLVIVNIVAGLLFIGGLWSIYFVWRRYFAIRAAKPVAAEFCIVECRDEDATTYTVDIKVPGTVWRIGVAKDRSSNPYADGQARSCQAWLHPRTRELLSLSVEGRHMNTLPAAHRIKPHQFGQPN